MANMTGTLAGRSFRGLVVLMGSNDIVGDYGDPERVEEHYHQVLSELQEAFDVPIFVMAVFPTNLSYSFWNRETVSERTGELNRRMEAYCAETQGLTFIDATAPFTDENGLLRHDLGDGLHIHPDYYEDFYHAVEQALAATGMFWNLSKDSEAA